VIWSLKSKKFSVFFKKNIFNFFFFFFLKGNKDFEEFQAIMHFLKTPCFNSLSEIKIDTLSWGIKSSSKRKVF